MPTPGKRPPDRRGGFGWSLYLVGEAIRQRQIKRLERRLIKVQAKAPPPEPWWPECRLAQIELRMARSICWDYDKFRYHLDRACELERQYQDRQSDPTFGAA